MGHDYDLLVLGGGSGGVRAARMAGAAGARVALIESGAMGGTCVNVGCVPKKLYTYAAGYGRALQDSAGFGWTASGTLDWSVMVARKDAEIHRLNGIYDGLLAGTGVELVRGHGVVTGPHTMEVNGRTLSAETLLIAVGGKPWLPEIEGREHVWNSDDVFEVTELPDRIVVYGGGYIGVEFASIFAGCGVDVTLVHRGANVLRGFDEEVRIHMTEQLRAAGVTLLLEQTIASVQADGVTLGSGERVACGGTLFATGRRPSTRNLGLEALGVKLDAQGVIEVDERYRTAVESIRAVGDVIEGPELTPVALAEGMFVARDLTSDVKPQPLDYRFIPTAVFGEPHIGTVGYTEKQAVERFGRVRVYRSAFRPMIHTLSGRDQRAMMKLIVDDRTDRVVGCHMVGPEAGEIVQGFAVAMRAGATKEVFDTTIGVHPTSAEEFVTMRTVTRYAN